MEAKVIITTPLELKAIVSDAVAAALQYHQPSVDLESNNDDTPLNVESAADFLGISKQTLYQNINRVPHKKRFGKLYFFKNELLEYLNDGEGTA